MHEPGHRSSPVSGTREAICGRLSGAFAGSAAALWSKARSHAAGWRSQPYGQSVVCLGAAVENSVAVAADTVAGTQPDGNAVGAGQGRRLRQHTVRHYCRTDQCVHCARERLVESAGVANLWRVVGTFLVETGTVKKLLRTYLAYPELRLNTAKMVAKYMLCSSSDSAAAAASSTKAAFFCVISSICITAWPIS